MVIEKLVVKTGSACTLKCEKCGEFNPYLKGKGKAFSLDAQTLSRDVRRIAGAVERIKTIHIAGGGSSAAQGYVPVSFLYQHRSKYRRNRACDKWNDCAGYRNAGIIKAM